MLNTLSYVAKRMGAAGSIAIAIAGAVGLYDPSLLHDRGIFYAIAGGVFLIALTVPDEPR